MCARTDQALWFRHRTSSATGSALCRPCRASAPGRARRARRPRRRPISPTPIALGDKAMVSRAPGVGPKVAQRIVAEFKDKAPALRRHRSGRRRRIGRGCECRRTAAGRRRGVGAGQSRLWPRAGRGARRGGGRKAGARRRAEELIRLGLRELEHELSRDRLAAASADEDAETSAASADARRVHRPGRRPGQSRGLHRGGARTRRGARPCAVRRAAGPRQDHAGADRGARARRELPRDVRAGDREGRRPRGAPHQSRGPRRPLHRRDPSAQPGGRGNSLSGDGGLSARPDHRRGAGGAIGQHRSVALHADRRHDAHGSPHHAAA